MAVADVFDALTSKRVYKVAYTPEQAKSIIEQESGRHFDPAIVEAFLACYGDFLKIMRMGFKEAEILAAPPAEHRRWQATAAPGSTATGHERVLVVDSHPADLKTVSQWLTKAGYDVVQAPSAEQGIARIKQACPQFVITDWKMPGLNGGDLCRWIRRERLPNPVYTFITTAMADSVDVVRTHHLGADELLAKPLQKNELLARVRSAARILQLEDQLRRLARSDPLTGMPTRQLMGPQMEREWQRALRYHLPLSCLVLDIDRFERINEEHGQDAGDTALKAVAQTVLANSRASDLACRLAGDRFLVLLIECNEIHATLSANRIRNGVENAFASAGGKPIRVTASVGVAQRFADTANLDALIDLAEQALGIAKQSGRNRTVSYRTLGGSPNLVRAASELQRLPLEGHLAKDVMRAPVLCLRDADSAHEAAHFLLRRRINSAPVVDGEGRLVGIISEKDLLSQLSWTGGREFPIRHVMSAEVVCFEEDESAQEVFDFLISAVIRRVIIIKEGKPTGVISRATLLRWLADRSLDRLGRHPAELAGDARAENEIAANVRRLAVAVGDALSSPSPAAQGPVREPSGTSGRS